MHSPIYSLHRILTAIGLVLAAPVLWSLNLVHVPATIAWSPIWAPLGVFSAALLIAVFADIFLAATGQTVGVRFVACVSLFQAFHIVLIALFSTGCTCGQLRRDIAVEIPDASVSPPRGPVHPWQFLFALHVAVYLPLGWWLYSLGLPLPVVLLCVWLSPVFALPVYFLSRLYDLLWTHSEQPKTDTNPQPSLS